VFDKKTQKRWKRQEWGHLAKNIRIRTRCSWELGTQTSLSVIVIVVR